VVYFFCITYFNIIASFLKNIQLQELTSRRRQLVDMLTQEKNRLEKATNDLIICEIGNTISFLQVALNKIDSQINHFIDADPTLKAKKEIREKVSR
jgi:transposase